MAEGARVGLSDGYPGVTVGFSVVGAYDGGYEGISVGMIVGEFGLSYVCNAKS